MAKARKEGKKKKSRKSVLKHLKRIEQNEKILLRLKKEYQEKNIPK